MDAASKTRLSKVHPELAKRVERTIDALAAAGLEVRVVQGLRTYEEQNLLYAQGRLRKGPKVTNAKGGQSNHNFGLAVDLCPFDDGQPDWENAHAFALIGEAGKTQHLEWGGDWHSFPDRPHLQLHAGLDIAHCAQLFAHGGLDEVWREASKRLGLDHTVQAKNLVAAERVELEIPSIGKTPLPATQLPAENPTVPLAPPPIESLGSPASLGSLGSEESPGSLEIPERVEGQLELANQPIGDPPDAQPSHWYNVEDWKPMVTRWLKRIWSGNALATLTQTLGNAAGAIKDPEHWYVYAIIAVVLVVLLAGIGLVISLPLLAIWLWNRREIRDLKTEQFRALADPNMKNIGLIFEKK